MIWLIFGLVTLAVILLTLNWLANAKLRQLASVARWVLIIAALIILGWLLFSGRFALLSPLFLLVLPYFRRRLLSFLGGATGFSNLYQPTGSRTSEVHTKFFHMILDHDNNTVDGEIVKGIFSKRYLSSLVLHDLLELLDECYGEDLDSAQVLEAYLDRSHPDWREETSKRDTSDEGSSSWGSGPMTEEEAYGVLNLEPGATELEVKAAHHRLMKKVHPDQGGSDYLAAKINQAKDLLLDL